jgi:hypothetical protein
MMPMQYSRHRFEYYAFGIHLFKQSDLGGDKRGLGIRSSIIPAVPHRPSENL